MVGKEKVDDGRRHDNGSGRRGSNVVDYAVLAFGHRGVCEISLLP